MPCAGQLKIRCTQIAVNKTEVAETRPVGKHTVVTLTKSGQRFGLRLLQDYCYFVGKFLAVRHGSS